MQGNGPLSSAKLNIAKKIFEKADVVTSNIKKRCRILKRLFRDNKQMPPVSKRNKK